MSDINASLRYFRVNMRRVRHRRATLLLLLTVGTGSFILQNQPTQALIHASDSSGTPTMLRSEMQTVFASFGDRARKLQRAQTIAGYGHHYRINERLAHDIYAAAESAGIDPDLGFRLVKLESYFDEQATSPVGAIGLTQVMLPTAQFYDEDITAEQLYDRHVNLRIGFAYLREMLDQHEGDVMLALASYNRGPVYIERLLASGRVPNNAYERIIMKGYTGRGFLD